jgi:hypothetical protein
VKGDDAEDEGRLVERNRGGIVMCALQSHGRSGARRGKERRDVAMDVGLKKWNVHDTRITKKHPSSARPHLLWRLGVLAQ